MEKNIEELNNLISRGREIKGYSQRKLARLCKTSHTEIVRIENGERKKPDIEILRRISVELDISLIELIKAAGYDEFAVGLNEYTNKSKSTKGLNAKIDEYKKSELDLLDDSDKKRKNVMKQNEILADLSNKLKLGADISNETIVKTLNEVCDNLKISAKKYDYSKLPKKD